MRKREICLRINEFKESISALEFAKSTLDTHIGVLRDSIKEFSDMLEEAKKTAKKTEKKSVKKAEKKAVKKTKRSK
jgi:hypothetical protein